MSTWDDEIFSQDTNIDFLDELAQLEPDEIVEAVRDAVLLADGDDAVSDEELANARAAATIAGIWAGAPFSAGAIADTYPFIRKPGVDIDDMDERLAEAAISVLEGVGSDADTDQFIEALS